MICYNVITESMSLLLTDKFLVLNSKPSCDKKLRILRLYGRTHERQDYPDPIYTLKLLAEDEREGICRKEFKGDALHYKIRKGDENEIIKFEEDFCDVLKQGVMPSAVERKRLGSYQCIEYCLCGIPIKYLLSINLLLFFDIDTEIVLQMQKRKNLERLMI